MSDTPAGAPGSAEGGRLAPAVSASGPVDLHLPPVGPRSGGQGRGPASPAARGPLLPTTAAGAATPTLRTPFADWASPRLPSHPERGRLPSAEAS